MSLRPQAEYFVRFTGLSESFRVFNYSREAKTFTVTSYASARAGVSVDVARTIFSILGADVLTVEADGSVQVAVLNERAATKYPRLEFMRQLTEVPEVVAAVASDGSFYTRQVMEADDLPDGNDRIEFYGKAAFNQLGLVASAVIETGL